MIESVELLGGRKAKEGYVKVHLKNSVSGTVCPQNWGLPEAMVVCRQLGLKYADRSTSVSCYNLLSNVNEYIFCTYDSASGRTLSRNFKCFTIPL